MGQDAAALLEQVCVFMFQRKDTETLAIVAVVDAVPTEFDAADQPDTPANTDAATEQKPESNE